MAGFWTTSKSAYFGLVRSSSVCGIGSPADSNHSLSALMLTKPKSTGSSRDSGSSLRSSGISASSGDVRDEDIGVERPAQEGVVHTEEEVGEGRILAEDDFVQRFAGVAQGEDAKFDVVLRLKGGDDVLADAEGVVGCQGKRAFPPASAGPVATGWQADSRIADRAVQAGIIVS